MENNNKIWNVFAGAVLAGVSISIGCVVFLRVGGVAGAALFAFGLLTCVHFKLPLYTGTAGFVNNRKDLARLFLILGGNIVGCMLMAVAMKSSLTEMASLAGAITLKRAALQPWQTVILATMCGFIMTTAVKFGRERQFLPLLFGVPVFILCGFIHSIADAFYIMATDSAALADLFVPVTINYLGAVFGNFIGCNLVRIFYWRLSY